jgi:hypothetical protein
MKKTQVAVPASHIMVKIGDTEIPYYWAPSGLIMHENICKDEDKEIAKQFKTYYVAYCMGCKKANQESMSFEDFMDLVDTDMDSFLILDNALANFYKPSDKTKK